MNNFFEQINEQLKAKSPLHLRIKVIPESQRNEVVEVMEDETIKVRIKAPATDGKANSELVRFFKKELKAKEVMIITGHTDRLKLLRIQ